MPSNAAHDDDAPQAAATPAEEIVLSLPDEEWAAVKQVADAIFDKPHAWQARPPAVIDTTVNPDRAKRLTALNDWLAEAHKVQAVDERPPDRETASEADHEVQVEAAQLKLILDRRLNRKTAQWIRDLAGS